MEENGGEKKKAISTKHEVVEGCILIHPSSV